MQQQQQLPIPFSYKVTEYFFAGEYPFEKDWEKGLPKLQKLLDFGITHFIDLTSERKAKYSEFLSQNYTYLNLPIIDYPTPDFSILKEIHMRIDEAKRVGGKTYVHCMSGHDRTGVAVATYFIYAGFSPLLAKQKFSEVFVPPVRGRYSYPPLIETQWEVLNQYEQFLNNKRRCQRQG